MKTSDWIEKKIGEIPTKNRYCSSVFQDTNGDFYSYGYHYPLLVKVRGLWILNTAGYSNTTAKHIGYCSRACRSCGQLWAMWGWFDRLGRANDQF
jgi:hypothetical protein